MASPQPAPDQPTGPEQAALGALATFLAETSLAGTVALPPYLYAKLLDLGLDRRAIHAAAALTLRGPIFRRPRVSGTASSLVAADEPTMRAMFLINAARRITEALTVLYPVRPDQPAPTARQRLEDALRRERAHWRMHLDAQRNRREAAQRADETAQVSPWLVWRTMLDGSVERDCARLEGRVFTVDDPPRIHGRPVYPGAVHPRCRCVAAPVADPALFGRQPVITAVPMIRRLITQGA